MVFSFRGPTDVLCLADPGCSKARPLALQRWGRGALPSRDSSVSQINRKKESQYQGNWLTANVGLSRKGDNGLGIPHVNIFKMPIASRQPFTSDICEELEHMEEGWETGSPPTQDPHPPASSEETKRKEPSFPSQGQTLPS